MHDKEISIEVNIFMQEARGAAYSLSQAIQSIQEISKLLTFNNVTWGARKVDLEVPTFTKGEEEEHASPTKADGDAGLQLLDRKIDKYVERVDV